MVAPSAYAFVAPLALSSSPGTLCRDFLQALPVSKSHQTLRRPRARHVHSLPFSEGRISQPTHTITVVAKASTPAKDIGKIRAALIDACLDPALNRGLELDPDAGAETEAEEVVEDLAEKLEDANTCISPTSSEYINGSWELIYTSSTLTRFHGGLTGMHRAVKGSVGRITQVIDIESGTSTYTEQIAYQIPVVRKKTAVDVVVTGKIRAVSDTRQMWTPEKIKAAWFNSFAESWKSLGAFTVLDTTYVDKELRITRGQTGSLTVYARTQPS